MSRIKNVNLLKDPQWHDLCIKGVQDSSRQTTTSIQEADLRYLSIENYLNIEKKSKQQILNSQFYYFNHLKLIPSAFYLNFDHFQIPNSTNSQQNPPTIFSSISPNQALQNILQYNKSKDFLISYTGFTRKTTTSLFLLFNFQQASKSQNHNNNLKFKISFLNIQGQVLHVCSNLDSKHVDKVNKIIKKHFSCLNTIIILLNRNLPLQQSEQILKALLEKNEVIPKIILFPKTNLTHGTLQSVESLIESNEVGIDQFGSSRSILKNARGMKDLNIKVIDSVEGRLQAGLVEELVQRGMQMLEIEDFVFEKMIKGEVAPVEMVYRNEWIINVTSLIFNILTSKKRNLISSLNEVSLRQDVQLKMYDLFVTSQQRMQQQKSLNKTVSELNVGRGSQQLRIGQCFNKCFPYLFETSKKCLVCRSSKPKFGCRECSVKYKREVHLCVASCFKSFHLETLKYISNQISLSEVTSPSIISTSITTGHSPSLDGGLTTVSKSYLQNSPMVSKIKNKHNKIKSQQILNHQSTTQNQLSDRMFKRKYIRKIVKCLSKQRLLIQYRYNQRKTYQLSRSPFNIKQPCAQSTTQIRKYQFCKNAKIQQSTEMSVQPLCFREQRIPYLKQQK